MKYSDTQITNFTMTIKRLANEGYGRADMCEMMNLPRPIIDSICNKESIGSHERFETRTVDGHDYGIWLLEPPIRQAVIARRAARAARQRLNELAWEVGDEPID